MTGTQVYADRLAGTELLLNHFTPGDGYEFTHQVVQEGAKKWKLSFQTGVDNRGRAAGVFPFEGWNRGRNNTTNKVAKTSNWCALHIYATYLVNQPTSWVVA